MNIWSFICTPLTDLSVFHPIELILRPYIELGGMSVPRFDIEQADVAPLMSSLIGSTIPTNNRGRLPLSYLDAEAVCKLYLFCFDLRFVKYDHFSITGV